MSTAIVLDVISPNNSTQQNTSAAENWTELYEVVRWIQIVTALLSIIGSGSIMVFAASQRLIQSPEIQPLLLLSVTDLLLALGWLVGAALFTWDRDTYINCYLLHTVEQTLYMMSFFYTLNYLWRLYSGLSRRLYCSINEFMTEESSRAATPRVIAVVSGVLPVLLMSPVWIQGNIQNCYANFSQPSRCLLMHIGALYLPSRHSTEHWSCWLLHTYRTVIFLLTFLLTFSAIMLLMAKARHIHRRVVASGGFLGGRQWATFRMVDRRLFLYPSVFVLCWAPALCVAVLSWIDPSAIQGLVGVIFYITQVFTSGSQGFLNSLVYGWTHARFRDARRTALLRDADTQTPLLRSQKRGYFTLPRGRRDSRQAMGNPCAHA